MFEKSKIETFEMSSGKEMTGCKKCFDNYFKTYDFCCDKRLETDFKNFKTRNINDNHGHCKVCNVLLDPVRHHYHIHCEKCDDTFHHIHCKDCDYKNIDSIQKCLHFHCPECKDLIIDNRQEEHLFIDLPTRSEKCKCGLIDWGKINLFF